MEGEERNEEARVSSTEEGEKAMEELLLAEAGPYLGNVSARISSSGYGCARMEVIQKWTETVQQLQFLN